MSTTPESSGIFYFLVWVWPDRSAVVVDQFSVHTELTLPLPYLPVIRTLRLQASGIRDFAEP